MRTCVERPLNDTDGNAKNVGALNRIEVIKFKLKILSSEKNRKIFSVKCFLWDKSFFSNWHEFEVKRKFCALVASFICL